MLVNHYKFTGRSHLTALLSEDEGETWKYKLLLDEREPISYPDATEADDGYIYITYDRERGSFANSLDEVYSEAREILIAKITEDDIINGSIRNSGSRLKWVASKLGKYIMEKKNPFDEITRLSDEELVKRLMHKDSDDIIASLFECFQVNCINLHKVDNIELDALIEKFNAGVCDKKETILKIIALIRSVSTVEVKEIPIVERVKGILQNASGIDISVKEIAEKIGMSQYYLCHLFKKTTGVTIIDYKNELKLTKAKELLVNSDKKIGDISFECGFGSESYFSKIFLEAEKVSPSSYRKLLKYK